MKNTGKFTKIRLNATQLCRQQPAAPEREACSGILCWEIRKLIAIPEPSSGLLLMLGSAVFGAVRRRRNG